jgi:hypothetical protein
MTVLVAVVVFLVSAINSHHVANAFVPSRRRGAAARRYTSARPSSSQQQNQVNEFSSSLPNIRAAVIVPGFLTGQQEFTKLQQLLTYKYNIPTVVVPMPNWHWLPCLGGRSMRPMLERIDFAVQHMTSVAGNLTNDNNNGTQVVDPQLLIPNFSYNIFDLIQDFMYNPGGKLEVGGSAEVDNYPIYIPKGTFPRPSSPSLGKVALIGHSAGGWICRAYISNKDYGGRVYNGHEFVHSLITLGSPHGNAPGPAFKGVEWVNRNNTDIVDSGVRALAVGGTGYKGNSSGELTRGAYSFCCPYGSDGSQYDGDGVTPIDSALAMKQYMTQCDTLVLDNVGHFCWSDVFGGSIVAPELTKYHLEGRPWYGDDAIVAKWVNWL